MIYECLYGHDADVAKFVGDLVGNPDFGICKAIGVCKKGVLVGGVVYSNYTHHNGKPINMEITAAAADSRWLTRHTLKELYSYPFIQLGLPRITASTPIENKAVIAVDEKMGFVFEGIGRKAHFLGGDLYCMGMLKEECKWI